MIKNSSSDVKQQIIKISNDIRKKFNALKLNRDVQDETLSHLYKPITQQLNDIVQNTKRNENIDESMNIKDESTKIKDESNDSSIKSKRKSADTIKTFIDEYPSIVRPYVNQYFNNKHKIDTSYGLNYNIETAIWSMGNCIVNFEFETGDIIVDGKHKFDGTPGLYNLLFFKDVPNPSKEDLPNYVKILKLTNAHRCNYDPKERVRGSKLIKYQKIIKPLLITGKGLQNLGESKMVNNKNIEYVYWDDVNEIVDRLRLLIASKMAGNNSHENEISSILEELKEIGYIQ